MSENERVENDLHPAAKLFVRTVTVLVTDAFLYPKKSIDPADQARTIEAIDKVAKRAQNAKSAAAAISPERAAGQVTTLFAGFLDRYWDMELETKAAHGGEFHIQARGLIFVHHTPAQQHH